MMNKKSVLILITILSANFLLFPAYKTLGAERVVPVNESYKDLSSVNEKQPIGVGKIEGIVTEIVEESANAYIIIKSDKGDLQLYYSSDENIKKALKEFKAGDRILIKYVLGTPAKYKDMSGFPMNAIVKKTSDEVKDPDVIISLEKQILLLIRMLTNMHNLFPIQ